MTVHDVYAVHGLDAVADTDAGSVRRTPSAALHDHLPLRRLVYGLHALNHRRKRIRRRKGRRQPAGTLTRRPPVAILPARDTSQIYLTNKTIWGMIQAGGWRTLTRRPHVIILAARDTRPINLTHTKRNGHDLSRSCVR